MSAHSLQGFVTSLGSNHGMQIDSLAASFLQAAAVGVLIVMALGLAWSIRTRLHEAGQDALSANLTDLKRKARKTEEDYEKKRRELSH